MLNLLLKREQKKNEVGLSMSLAMEYNKCCEDLKKYREEYVKLQEYDDPADDYVIKRLKTLSLILDDLKEKVVYLKKEITRHS